MSDLALRFLAADAHPGRVVIAGLQSDFSKSEIPQSEPPTVLLKLTDTSTRDLMSIVMPGCGNYSGQNYYKVNVSTRIAR